MRLCFGTSETLTMHRGIMQGSAFSADVFSRMMDWYLSATATAVCTDVPGLGDSDKGIAALSHLC